MIRAEKPLELQRNHSWKATGATEWSELESQWSHRVIRAGKLPKLQSKSVKLSELQDDQSWKAIGATEGPELESYWSCRDQSWKAIGATE